MTGALRTQSRVSSSKPPSISASSWSLNQTTRTRSKTWLARSRCFPPVQIQFRRLNRESSVAPCSHRLQSDEAPSTKQWRPARVKGSMRTWCLRRRRLAPVRALTTSASPGQKGPTVPKGVTGGWPAPPEEHARVASTISNLAKAHRHHLAPIPTLGPCLHPPRNPRGPLHRRALPLWSPVHHRRARPALRIPTCPDRAWPHSLGRFQSAGQRQDRMPLGHFWTAPGHTAPGHSPILFLTGKLRTHIMSRA